MEQFRNKLQQSFFIPSPESAKNRRTEVKTLLESILRDPKSISLGGDKVKVNSIIRGTMLKKNIDN
jgi:hypothetical protein